MLRSEEHQSGCSCHAFGLDFREGLVSGNHHAVHVGDSTAYQVQKNANFQLFTMNQNKIAIYMGTLTNVVITSST